MNDHRDNMEIQLPVKDGVDTSFEDICSFCDEVNGRDNRFHDLGIGAGRLDYILMESERFVVVPCMGALTDWYVLIVPKRHVLSTGWMNTDERNELQTLCDEVCARLERMSGQSVVVFEHGSYDFRDKGGACHDHAHIHVVGTDRPVGGFVDFVSQSLDLDKCEDWIQSASDTVDGERRSYLAVSSGAESWIGRSDSAPSGFFRKSLMRWIGGDPAEHDWLVFPQVERLKRMVREGI